MPKTNLGFKITLLWTPLLLWYLVGFFTTQDAHYFRSIDTIYYGAGEAWRHTQPLYHCKGNGCFVYLPPSAAFFSLFSILPLQFAELIYRLLSLGIITWGIWVFCSIGASCYRYHRYFWTLLVTVLLAQSTLFNGEFHFILTGLILLGYAALIQKQDWQASLYLTLALALKPTALVLYLLAGVVYPRILLRLIVVSGGIFLLSFLLQTPSYVANMYIDFVRRFQEAMQFDALNGKNWATLFGAISFYTGYTISGNLGFCLRALAAILACWFCRVKQKESNSASGVYLTLSLGLSYLMLFNSRSENSDYIMIAPMLGYTLSCLLYEKKRLAALLIIVIVLAICFNWVLSHALTPNNNLWLNPSVITVFTLYFLYPKYVKMRTCLN